MRVGKALCTGRPLCLLVGHLLIQTAHRHSVHVLNSTGSLDSTRHRDILRHSLVPSFRQFYPSGPWNFQQDNAR